MVDKAVIAVFERIEEIGADDDKIDAEGKDWKQ